MRYAAMRLIKDEHRSLSAVLRAAEHLAGKAVSTGKAVDFKLLRAMLYYLREFPEQRHHPNEDRMLFARIKARTHEADAAIAELEDEHRRGDGMLQSLTIALDSWETGAAFESHRDPMFGEDIAHEFRDLFSRIIRLAPQPIGEGDPKN